MERSAVTLLAVALGMVVVAPPSRAQETPKDIIAAHLRIQGYACDSPRSAKRDARASGPDASVWVIQCENGRYRVRLVPDMAAVVEPMK